MHPWGLSGPEFLWLYGAGMVVGIAVAVGMRTRVRRPTLAEPPGRLDPEELGFLGGGPANAVQVAVARLAQNEAVRVDRNGTLTATVPAQPSSRPLDAAVLAELTTPRTVPGLIGRPAVDRAVAEIGESLVRRGLLVAPAQSARARLLGPVVLAVVFAVGVVRWINGTANDLPVGYLTFLLAMTFMALVYLNVRTVSAPKARTVHGDRVVAEVRARGTQADPLERVAVGGPRFHPDTDLSIALCRSAPVAFTPATWSYASSGSFVPYVHTPSGSGSSGGGDSGGTSSSCGSSSCGGGGGCGGGSSS